VEQRQKKTTTTTTTTTDLELLDCFQGVRAVGEGLSEVFPTSNPKLVQANRGHDTACSPVSVIYYLHAKHEKFHSIMYNNQNILKIKTIHIKPNSPPQGCVSHNPNGVSFSLLQPLL